MKKENKNTEIFVSIYALVVPLLHGESSKSNIQEKDQIINQVTDAKFSTEMPFQLLSLPLEDALRRVEKWGPSASYAWEWGILFSPNKINTSVEFQLPTTKPKEEILRHLKWARGIQAK